MKALWDRPRGYKTWVHSQTQNKAQRGSQSLRFILSLRLYSSFITLRPADHGGWGIIVEAGGTFTRMREVPKEHHLLACLSSHNTLLVDVTCVNVRDQTSCFCLRFVTHWEPRFYCHFGASIPYSTTRLFMNDAALINYLNPRLISSLQWFKNHSNCTKQIDVHFVLNSQINTTFKPYNNNTSRYSK